MPYHHLSRSERGKIALMHRHKVSLVAIAQSLGRSVSTISREITRNKANSSYQADAAHLSYLNRRAACHRTRLYEDAEVREYVVAKLLICWSPEQIAGRLRLENTKKPCAQVSFSSIYRWLHEGLLPRVVMLKERLRRFRRRRKPGRKQQSRSDAKGIAARAKSVLGRGRYGDWEVDTISFGMFPHQTYLLNINERKSKYCALVLLRNIKREEVMRGFSLFFEDGRLPLRTMTSDRGMEFNCHNEFEAAFLAPYYYTDKGKPWQKPTVENTNGLLRQFLPRGTKVHELPPERIPEIMRLLNNRPRKSLGFKTPTEVLHLS